MAKPCDRPSVAEVLSCCRDGVCRWGCTDECRDIEQARSEYMRRGGNIHKVDHKPYWRDVLRVVRALEARVITVEDKGEC